jgi:hypothetical protein
MLHAILNAPRRARGLRLAERLRIMTNRARIQGAFVGMLGLGLTAMVTEACSAGDPGVITPSHVVGPQGGSAGMPGDSAAPPQDTDSGFDTIPDASTDTAHATPDAGEAGAAMDAASASLITSFTLIDTSVTGIIQGSPVPGYDPIPAGSTISLATVGTNLSVRANVNSTVGSIQFAHDQTTHTENRTPYMLCGDDGTGTIANCNLTAGTYALTATPYTDANLGGTAETPYSLTFTLTP